MSYGWGTRYGSGERSLRLSNELAVIRRVAVVSGALGRKARVFGRGGMPSSDGYPQAVM
jgi:hypothetical protein